MIIQITKYFIIITNFEYADLDNQNTHAYSLISVIDKLQVYLLMQYLHFSMYVHMYQITFSVVARLSNHNQGLPQGLFSVCSYLLKPTGNHGQTQEGVLGVVFISFVTSFRFTISIQGFIACSILATENEHLASLISWKYITFRMPLW